MPLILSIWQYYMAIIKYDGTRTEHYSKFQIGYAFLDALRDMTLVVNLRQKIISGLNSGLIQLMLYHSFIIFPSHYS